MVIYFSIYLGMTINVFKCNFNDFSFLLRIICCQMIFRCKCWLNTGWTIHHLKSWRNAGWATPLKDGVFKRNRVRTGVETGKDGEFQTSLKVSAHRMGPKLSRFFDQLWILFHVSSRGRFPTCGCHSWGLHSAAASHWFRRRLHFGLPTYIGFIGLYKYVYIADNYYTTTVSRWVVVIHRCVDYTHPNFGSWYSYSRPLREARS